MAAKRTVHASCHSPKLTLGWQRLERTRSIGFSNFGETLTPSELPQLYEAADDEGHLITIAGTGRGKGRCALIPTLLSYRGSLVVIDPKGEAVAVTARRRKAMSQQIVVIEPFAKPPALIGGLNPFDILAITGQSTEDFALEMAHMLHHGMKKSLSDPFWDDKADGLLGGVITYVAVCEPPEQRHLIRVRDILNDDDVVYKLAVILDTAGKRIPKFAYQQIAAFLQTEEKCRSGILATAQQHFISMYGDGVEVSLNTTSFDLAAFRDGAPISIYLVIPPAKLQSHGRLLRLWIASLLSVVMSRTQRPEVPTLFLLDEAAQLGEMESIRTMMTLMRAWGARLWSFWQDLSQIKRLYSDYESLLNNAATMQIFGISTHVAAKSIAEVLGEGIQPRDLLNLPEDEAIILESPGRISRVRRLDYLLDPLFHGLYSENPLYRAAAMRSVGK